MGAAMGAQGEVAMGAPMGARARARQARQAAREAAVIQGEERAPEIPEVRVWFQCAFSYCRMAGNYTLSAIAQHKAVHRAEEQKAREAQENRAAARQQEAEARGKKPGKAARKKAARDKRFGK